MSVKIMYTFDLYIFIINDFLKLDLHFLFVLLCLNKFFLKFLHYLEQLLVFFNDALLEVLVFC